ncbi:prepilin-type N-terminal cleavage/methylation domain-containing protein [bacterium]|nr:prepilin-type N-terminal cleavage/methylation domain-containing protein [bacterium]
MNRFLSITSCKVYNIKKNAFTLIELIIVVTII